jgi:hypothetical protein
MRKYGAALVMGVLLVTSACGGGGNRPSVSDVSQVLRKGGDGSLLGAAGASLNKKAADCIAGALVHSKLSDKALRAIVDGDTGYKGSSSDQAAVSGVTTKMTKCVADNITAK